MDRSLKRPGVACLLLLALGCGSGAPAPVQVVDVEAGDFYFRAPDTIAAGRTEFRLRNANGRHVMLVVRLDSGRTLADAMQSLDQPRPPSWVHDLGGPVTAESLSVVSTTLDLTPGRHLLVCYFNDAGGKPHAASGMIRELMVSGPAASGGALPAADVVATLTDFTFELTRPLPRGPHTIRFVNSGRQSHEVIMVRLRPGTHLEDWLRSRAAGTAPPGSPAGGIGSLAPNSELVMAADFAPGDYLWICFFRDEADGHSHLEKGMIREIHVD